MDDNFKSDFDSSRQTYRSLPDSPGNLTENHVNPAFEDNEIILPVKNGWSANSKVYDRRLSNGLELPGKGLRHYSTDDSIVESIRDIQNHLNPKENINGNGVHIHLTNGHSDDAQKKKQKEHKKSKKKDDDAGDHTHQDKIPPVNFFSLFRYSSRLDKLLMCIACVIALCVGAALPVIIVLFGNIVDRFIENHKAMNDTLFSEVTTVITETETDKTDKFIADISRLCAYVAVCGACIFCCNYIMVSFFSMTASNQAFKIRCLFMKSVLRQDIGWFDTNQTGDFASRITADLNRIQDGIGEKVAMCVSFISQCMLAIIFALVHGWKLTLVILCIMPILSISMAIIAKIQAAVSGDELSSYGAAGAIAEEVLSSIRTVVAFGGEKKEIERYDKLLQVAKADVQEL